MKQPIGRDEWKIAMMDEQAEIYKKQANDLYKETMSYIKLIKFYASVLIITFMSAIIIFIINHLRSI